MGTLFTNRQKNTIIGKSAKEFFKAIGVKDLSKTVIGKTAIDFAEGKLVEPESNDPDRFKEVITK